MTTSVSTRTTICSPSEVLIALGKGSTATDDDRACVNMLLPLTDATIRTFLGWEVIQATYTHLLPDIDLFDGSYNDAWGGLGEPFDAVGNRISYGMAGVPQILQCPEIPLRSVTSFNVDFSASGGQQSGDFAAATQLTLGADYYIDFDAPDAGQTVPYLSGVCWTGHIRRYMGGIWPYRMRTARVTYVAGVTPDELDAHQLLGSRRVGDIKFAAILTAMAAYQELKSWGASTSGAVGPIIAERLADYSVSYAEAAILQTVGLMNNMPFKAENLLRPHQRCKR